MLNTNMFLHTRFDSMFPMASDDALDLLSKMFAYDPKARISVQQALEHRYLTFIFRFGGCKAVFLVPADLCILA